MDKPDKPTAAQVKALWEAEFGTMGQCKAQLNHEYRMAYDDWLESLIEKLEGQADVQVILMGMLERFK